jgi:GNAT superfamily N-acetyltransferase
MTKEPHDIRPITLPIAGLDELQQEAAREGYAFLDRLAADWASGENRFDGPGEMLCGRFDGGQLVAVGGLDRDPFLEDPRVGRIRRVYVRPAWRNQGLGTALVLWLVDAARRSFAAVRLRAENPGAARLYERLGFTAIADPNATHILHFREACNGAGSDAAGTSTVPPA